MYGPAAGARLGRWLTEGDLNGDGLSDLIAGAPNVGDSAGQVYVFYGGPTFPGSTNDADITLSGFDAGDDMGTEVFGTPPILVANIDGNAGAELLISAAQADGPDNARVDAGEAYAVFLH